MLLGKRNKVLMAQILENNQLLANVLTQIAETNSKHTEEMVQKGQESNQILANTLTQLVEMQAKQNEKEPEEKKPELPTADGDFS